MMTIALFGCVDSAGLVAGLVATSPGPTGQPHKPQPALAGASQPNELIEDIN